MIGVPAKQAEVGSLAPADSDRVITVIAPP
jgi:hypothetical protein